MGEGWHRGCPCGHSLHLLLLLLLLVLLAAGGAGAHDPHFSPAAHVPDEGSASLERGVAPWRRVALFGLGGQLVGGDEDEGCQYAEGGARGGVVVAAGVVRADLGFEAVAGDGVKRVVGGGRGLGGRCSRAGVEEAGARDEEGRRVAETSGGKADRGGDAWRHVGEADGDAVRRGCSWVWCSGKDVLRCSVESV